MIPAFSLKGKPLESIYEGEGTLTLGGGVRVRDHHPFSDKSFPAFSLFIVNKFWKPIIGMNTVGFSWEEDFDCTQCKG